jgi:TonB-dependent receptor
MLKMIRFFVVASLGFSGAAYSQDEPIEEVTVVGVRSALENALNNKRNSDVIMDGIAADDIGNFPDLNLAESLQRVTGIQMDFAGDEGLRRVGRIAVRGLPVDYANTTYNGQILAAPRPDLGFGYGNIESSVVSAVNVIKTPTARMDEGGLSGTIDIQSKRGLDVSENFLKLGLKSTYETLNEEHSPGYSLSGGWKSDDDRWGVIGSLSAAEQNFRGDVLRVNTYASSDTDGDGLDDLYVPSQVRAISRETTGDRLSATFGVEFQATDNLKIGLNALYVDDPFTHTWAMGRWYNAEQRIALESVSDPKFGETVTRVQFVNPEIRNQQRLIDVENETQAQTLDFEWSNDDWTVYGAAHRTEASQLAIGNIARRRLDDDLGNGINMIFDTGGGNVSKFEIQEISNLMADINTYSLGGCTAQEIADGRTESECVARDSGVGDWFHTINSGHEYDVEEEETALQLDIIRRFDGSAITSIEGGIKLRSSDQFFVRPEWALPSSQFDYSAVPDLESLLSFADATSTNGFFGGRLGDQITDFYYQNAALMRQALVGDQTFSGPTLDGLPAPADGGDIAGTFSDSSRDIFSAYAMATFDFSNLADGIPVRGNVGVRYVDTDRDTKAFRETDGVMDPITASTSFDDLLPSLNLIWDIRDDLILRAAYSETIVRPHARNFGVGQNIDVSFAAPDVAEEIEIELGNPDLLPFAADSIDLSLEWYGENSTTMSFAYFQKKVSNGFDNRALCPSSINDISSLAGASVGSLITGSLSLNSSGICEDEAGVPVTITDQVNNSDSFDINGYEIGILQTFDFLDTPIIRNMGIQANYTYVDTSEGPDKDSSGNTLPLAGVSDDTFNIIAFYEAEQIALRFAYTGRSDYFDETIGTVSGDNRFIDTQDRLDMQLSYNPKQLENLFLVLEVFNLTDEQFYAYQGTESRFREAREVGKTWSLQAQYQF